MVALPRAILSLSLAQSALGAFVCPSGYALKETEGTCTGGYYSTCSRDSCCYPVKTCASIKTSKTSAQRNTLCGGSTATDLMFWNDQVAATIVTGSAPTDAAIKTACCKLASEAKCVDWGTSGTPSCGTGKIRIEAAALKTTAAPSSPATTRGITNALYQGACCEQKALCGSGNTACETTHFKDAAKALTRYDTSGDGAADTAAEKAACCTPRTEATCSDWSGIISIASTTTCVSGSVVDPKVAAAGTNTPATYTAAEFETACCKAKAECSTFSCPATHTAKVGTTKCTTHETSSCAATTCCTLKSITTCGARSNARDTLCGADKFWDSAKSAIAYTPVATGTTAEQNAPKIAACCTLITESTCHDWKVRHSTTKCSASTFDAGPSVKAAPDTDGKTLTDAKYKEICCKSALKCNSATAPSGTTGSNTEASSSWRTGMSTVSIWAGFLYFSI